MSKSKAELREAPGHRAASRSSSGQQGVRLAPPRYDIAFADAPALQAKAAAGGLRAGNLGPTGHGSRLPDLLRNKMERSFGADFSAVRIHHDSQAQSIHARAFTRGDHIHFAPGEYSPHSHAGQALIGHELAHVVQQRSMPSLQRSRGLSLNFDPRLEQQADMHGAKAAHGERIFGGIAARMDSAVPTSNTVQAAYTARRALQGAPFMLGPAYHEHIVFEDGGDPANRGYMGADRGLDTDVIDERYAQVRAGLDDARMRQAAANVEAAGNWRAQDYRLLGHNCQTYVAAVLAEYDRLAAPPKVVPPKQLGNGGGGNNRSCEVNGCAVM